MSFDDRSCHPDAKHSILKAMHKQFYREIFISLLSAINGWLCVTRDIRKDTSPIAVELIQIMMNIVDIAVLFQDKTGLSAVSANTKFFNKTIRDLLYVSRVKDDKTDMGVFRNLNNYFVDALAVSHQSAAKRAKWIGPAISPYLHLEDEMYLLLKFLSPYCHGGVFASSSLNKKLRDKLELAIVQANGKNMREFQSSGRAPEKEVLLAAVRQNHKVFGRILSTYSNAVHIPQEISDEAIRQNPNWIFAGMRATRQQVLESIAKDGRILCKNEYGKLRLTKVGEYIRLYPLTDSEKSDLYYIRRNLGKSASQLRKDLDRFDEVCKLNVQYVEPPPFRA